MERPGAFRSRNNGIVGAEIIARPWVAAIGRAKMALRTEDKSTIIEKHRVHEGDTGSPEVQVALLTARIAYLTDHMKGHDKDFSSRRGLLKLVGQRRRLLKYLQVTDPKRYQTVIGDLGLRR
jgi:small subunit ribosomal protein S15